VKQIAVLVFRTVVRTGGLGIISWGVYLTAHLIGDYIQGRKYHYPHTAKEAVQGGMQLTPYVLLGGAWIESEIRLYRSRRKGGSSRGRRMTG
jgi:hypothetical protein